MGPSVALPKDPESRFFRRWAEIVLRYRFLWLGLTLAVSAGMVMQIRRCLTTDMSVEAFGIKDALPVQLLEEFRDIFGRDDLFMVLVEGDVFTMPFLRKLQAAHAEITALDMDVPSLGQRKKDRDRVRGRMGLGSACLWWRRCGPGEHGGAPNPSAPAPPAKPASAAPSGDGFEDAKGGDGFDDFEGAEAGTGWEGVKGGSIIDEVISLINVRRTRMTPNGLQVRGLMDDFPTADRLPAIKAEVLADPKLVGQVVDREGRYAVLVVRTQFMNEADSARVNDRLVDIMRKQAGDDFKVHVSGLPALGASLNRLMLEDLRRMLLLAVGTLVLVLLVVVRHPAGVIGPVVVVLLALVWALGIMGTLGMPMTMITNILPAFLICVGVGDAVHIQSVYRDARQRGEGSRPAIVGAIATTGVPVLFTTLTTVFGLLSFKFARVEAVGELGVGGAFGVSVALLHSLVTLPIVLSFFPNARLVRREAGGLKLIDRFLSWCAALSGRGMVDPLPRPPAVLRRRRIRTLTVGAIITVASGIAASQLRVWHNPLTWLPDGMDIRTSFDAMDSHLGGTATVQVMVRARGDGVTVKDRDIILGMEALEQYIKDYVHKATGERIVGNALSVLDVVKETHRTLHGDDPAQYRVPKDQQGVTDAFTMFESGGKDDLMRLVTLDYSLAQMTFRLRWLDATSYFPLSEYIQAGIEKHIPHAKATAQVTGSVYNLLTTVGALIMDLIRSFTVAFSVITLLMILLLRDLKLGLVAMVPNLVPIVFLMGFMGVTQIPIDMANLLIASIAIGVAVDDTIHFLHHFKAHFDLNGDVDEAIAHSLRHSGRAMVATSVILALGFFVYLGATMISLQRFGMLIGMTVVVALLTDLILGPALLRALYRPRGEEPTETRP